MLAALIATATAVQAQTQTIDFQWPNQPCSDMLSCDQGCSACNLPAGGNSLLMGTNMAWIGVSTCPLPFTPGDNAVFTTGWPAAPDNAHYLLFSGIAGAPMRIDSLIINSTSATNGPERLKVEFTNNAAAALIEIADLQVPPSLGDLVLIDLGEIAFPEGSQWGSFQVKITPYQGWGEGWAVNEVRVVCSPVEQTGVGIAEMWNNRTLTTVGPWFDVMGRRTGEEPAPGVYIGPTKRVQVF